MRLAAPSFDVYGDAEPASPVILSVPHAGREYPLALRAALQVPVAALVPLEDRFADALAIAARERESMLIQRRARAWIDLNRAENDRDPAIDRGVARTAMPQQSAKLRGGLGLIPRRAAGSGSLWRRAFEDGEVVARITEDHRPYHEALAILLARARARFGVAVLLDIHSMPALGAPEEAPSVVLGDRFGKACAARFIDQIAGAAEAGAVRYAVNAPYAGGHILDRHADPARGIHAVQIEFDRSLYLDVALDQPGSGLAATARILRAMIDAAAVEALARSTLLAAE